MNFIKRLCPKNIEEKPGRDLYRWSIFIQLIILIYIFCFYPRLEGDATDISDSFTSNYFSGRMVIAMLFHIGVILLDRYIYLECTSSIVAVGIED